MSDTSELATVFDADNHYWEASDAFTRYRSPGFAERGVLVREVDGRMRYMVHGDLHPWIPGPGDVNPRQLADNPFGNWGFVQVGELQEFLGLELGDPERLSAGKRSNRHDVAQCRDDAPSHAVLRSVSSISSSLGPGRLGGKTG